jgi:hypothetical protein
MWHTEHTLETTAKPEAIWLRWKDVDGWPDWDEGLEWARLLGPLKVGSSGSLKCKGSALRRFTVEEVQEGRGFTCLGKCLLTRMRLVLRVEPCKLGSRVTHRIEVEGPMAWWLRLTMARRISQTLAPAARKLARLAAKHRSD